MNELHYNQSATGYAAKSSDGKSSRVMVVSALLMLAVMTSAASANSATSSGGDRRLSPRVVTTKYGAIRGYIATLPARSSLQPVEVFMGK